MLAIGTIQELRTLKSKQLKCEYIADLSLLSSSSDPISARRSRLYQAEELNRSPGIKLQVLCKGHRAHVSLAIGRFSCFVDHARSESVSVDDLVGLLG